MPVAWMLWFLGPPCKSATSVSPVPVGRSLNVGTRAAWYKSWYLKYRVCLTCKCDSCTHASFCVFFLRCVFFSNKHHPKIGALTIRVGCLFFQLLWWRNEEGQSWQRWFRWVSSEKEFPWISNGLIKNILFCFPLNMKSCTHMIVYF